MMYPKLPLIIGFAVGVFSDDIMRGITNVYVKARSRKIVISAEDLQRQFLEQRRKAMGNDDD